MKNEKLKNWQCVAWLYVGVGVVHFISWFDAYCHGESFILSPFCKVGIGLYISSFLIYAVETLIAIFIYGVLPPIIKNSRKRQIVSLIFSLLIYDIIWMGLRMR